MTDIERYRQMLEAKALRVPPCGIPNPPELHERLFDFQRETAKWALRRGRACVFFSTGLGKTGVTIEWARVVAEHTGHPVIIFTPLAVAPQFVKEGKLLGVEVKHCREQEDVVNGVNVINYDRIDKIDCSVFGGVALDESSILRDFNGKTRNALIDSFRETRFKLCASATPAPNDHTELGNHAEFIGAMTRTEMLSMFFVHDGGSTQDWRLKGHAKRSFWEWVATWAVAIRSPEDLGFDGTRYILPELTIDEEVIPDDGSMTQAAGMLIGYRANTLSEQRAARRASLGKRVAKTAEIVNSSYEQWIVWCDLNDESTALASAIPDAVEVRGSQTNEAKERAIADFVSGKARVLVSKPSICGLGLNLQHCHLEVFVGLGYSWELYYQAIRRVWRFGQTKPVRIVVVTSETEGRVVEVIRRKQADADAMADGMIGFMRDVMRRELGALSQTKDDYNPTKAMRLPTWIRK